MPTTYKGLLRYHGSQHDSHTCCHLPMHSAICCLFFKFPSSLSLTLNLFLCQYTASGKSLPKVELADDMCAVCGQRIILSTADSPEPTERTYRLSCHHLYPSCSEFCSKSSTERIIKQLNSWLLLVALVTCVTPGNAM